jgi:hypothetical protein
MDKAAKAKELLRHYFRLIAQRAEIHWDSDNDAEVEDIVDFIIGAAVERSEMRSVHTPSMPTFEPDE